MIQISSPELPELEDYTAYLEDIWESKMLSNFGHYAECFEDQIKRISGARYCSVVSSCDVGLIITLKAFDLKRGSEVLVPSFTFNSTGNALLWNNLKPRFVDIRIADLNLDLEDLKSKINKKTSAILATNTFGIPSDLKELEEIAKEHSIPLIFDSAQAFGSLYNERPIAKYGDAHVFSFAGTKIVTSGEGGAVVTPHKDIDEKVRYIRGYGFRKDYNGKYLGINGKISELNAALGLLNIDHVYDNIDKRSVLYNHYRALLTRNQLYHFPQIGDHTATYPYFTLVFKYPKDSIKVEKRLYKHGVQTKRYYLPLHKTSMFRKFHKGHLYMTDWIYSRILNLPNHTGMEANDVEYICNTIRGVLNG